MVVLLINDYFDCHTSETFLFLKENNLLPKFGHDYTVENIVNYEYGLVGYKLREIPGIFPNGNPITFFSERFLILSSNLISDYK